MGQVSLRAMIKGGVQGVYFRAFIRQHARALAISGYVRNLDSGDVEVYAEGRKERLEELLKHLRKGPPGAQVDEVEITWGEYKEEIKGFEIKY